MTELVQAEAAQDEAEGNFRTIERGGVSLRLLPKITARPLVEVTKEQPNFQRVFEGIFHPDDVELAIDSISVVELTEVIAETMGVDVPKSSGSAGS